MDIDFLRTFLEVKRTKHFARAAKTLFVSQSTISARIRLLEESLNTKLFTRDRNDIQLTAAGKKLAPQAETLVELWEQTRRSLSGQPDLPTLQVACHPALWSLLLQAWTQQPNPPSWRLRGDCGSMQAQQQGLLAKTLDLGLGFSLPAPAELQGQALAELELHLVSSQPALSWEEAVTAGFIQLDWGAETASELDQAKPAPHLQLPPGPWVVDVLRQGAASAYLPLDWVAQDLETQRLHRVAAAPSLTCRILAWTHRQPKQPKEVADLLRLLGATKNGSGWSAPHG